MSDPVPTPAAAAPAVDKKEWATRVIYDILTLMELPARLDVKDAPDGGISVALHFDVEVPGLQAGKRSHVIDALQFLANKVVNRPNTERRWISIGVGAHPEPRPPPQERPPRAAATPPAPAASAAAGAPAAPVAAAVPGQQPQRPQRPARGPGPARAAESDERSLEVSEDAALTEAARALAQKSAQFGRYVALLPMKQEDRARVVKAVGGVAGVSVRLEGEGRNRRVVFHPEKPAPMPKRTHPNFDDDEDEAED